jgi:hypothetical protein
MMRFIAGLLLIAAASLAWPDVVRAQAQGDALSQALEQRDLVIQQLLDRVEALERELRAIRDAQVKPAPVSPVVPQPPAAAAPAAPIEPPAPPTQAAEAPPPAPQAAPQPEAPIAPAPPVALPPAPVGPATSPPQAAEVVPPPSPPEEEEREVTRIPLASVERGGSLLRPGSFQIETNFGYTHSENTRLIISGFSVLPLIILGTLESERVKNDALSPAFSFRYGFMKDLQGDVRIPLIYQSQSRTRLSNDVSALVTEEANQIGLGDIDFGLTYQPLYEKGWIPDLTVSLRGTAPTGRSQFDIFKTISQQGGFISVEDFVRRLDAEGLPLGGGFWGATLSLGASKAFDPIVLFGSLGYSYKFGAKVTVVQITGTPSEGGIILHPVAIQADITPGGSLFFSLGAAVALTGQVSVNFSFSDRVLFKTKQNGVEIAASTANIGQFGAGFTLGLGRGITLDFSGSIGITPDAPSFALGLSVVKSFVSFKDLWPFGSSASP